MKTNVKKMRTAWAIGGSATALVLAGAVFASASANPPPNEWGLGYTDSTSANPDFASVGDLIKSTTMNLEFTGTYSGPATVSCVNVPTTGFNYTVPSTPPSGAPGTSIQIELNTPTTTLTGCTNSVDGQPVEVKFVAGSKWTLEIDLPSTSGTYNGEPHTGTLTGQITVPDGDPSGNGNGTVIATATTLAPYPCVLQGPALADMTVPGSYNPATGTASNTSTVPFYLDNGNWPPPGSAPQLSGIPTSQADCPNAGIQATLQSASVTLEGPDDAQGNPKTPTAVWSQ